MTPVQKETPRRARGLDSLPHKVQEFLLLFPIASVQSYARKIRPAINKMQVSSSNEHCLNESSAYEPILPHHPLPR